MNWPSPLPEQVPDAREEIERNYHFDDLRLARRVWSEEFIAAEYVAMMSTASDHRGMEFAKRSYLFAEMRRQIERRPGAFICRHNPTILQVARRKP
jgi:hypothetical protein